MYYLLHHSKGALILSADDRDQVVEWSKRQLGAQARTVSIIESDMSSIEGWVERSGTGLEAGTARGCRPMMSITADLPKGLKRLHQEEINLSKPLIKQQSIARERIWH
jgi:hypothetical protein